MRTDRINEILQINESFMLPERLMSILFDDDMKREVFDRFMEIGESLDHDWFTQYFEEEHANKSKMNQDFTPESISNILSEISGKGYMIADVCAGTGGLTIAMWNHNHDAFFHCEELSKRALPLLLFNLSIRNIQGEVVNMDVLNQDVIEIYKLQKDDKYSKIIIADEFTGKGTYDICIQNPPYSAKWGYDEQQHDDRMKYGYPPKAKADYAFIQHGLHLLNENGILTAILPHGILFRGQKEEQIRKGIIADNLLDCVIGLPDNMFLNTNIPTCIIRLDKRKQHDDFIFIDSSKNCRKDRKLNVMDTENIEKVVQCFRDRKTIDKFSNVVNINEIETNDFNLNIPRYVDTYEQEELPDIIQILEEMVATNKAIHDTEKSLIEMSKQLVGTTPEADRKLKKAINAIKNSVKNNNYVQEVLRFE